MNSLMPNLDLLKSPSNWALVAFSIILLIFMSNLLFKDDN